jgi:SprT-like family
MIKGKKPTDVAHAELQQAFVFLNERLFQSQLPDALITLQRKNPRCLGYFSADRFGNTRVSDTVDEIAMNPQHFRRERIETLQTLAHEMVHMWQAHYGLKKSQKAYHNAEWGAKMEAIGLMPSNTGKPGGKKTGQQMMDYVIVGGLFEAAARDLIESGFRPTYYDRDQPKKPEGLSAPTGDATGEVIGPATASGKRRKFSCPGCAGNAWARGAIKLICGECMEAMV